jgi:hypothetical protein
VVEISTFKDLEKWDKDRPIEWSKVIAFRVITRVVFSLVYQEKATILTTLNDEEILFHGFRTLFISDNIISHPDMLNELKHYSYAAYNSIVTQRHVSGVEARFTVPAANVAYLSSLTENDTGSVNSIIRDALEVIKTQLGLDGRYTYGTGHRGTNLSDKVFRGSDWTQFVFKDLSNDINKLTNGMHPCDLMREPLFMKNDIFKNPVYNKYIYARRKLLSDQGKWNFWIDWYQAKLDGTLHSGLTQAQQDDLYYKIATFPNELWEEGAEAVNQRIAELLNYQERGGEGFFLDDGHLDHDYLTDDEQVDKSSQKMELNSHKADQFRTFLNSPEFRSNVEKNKVAISFACAGIISQVEEYKKTVAGSNSLEPELKEQLLGTLEKLTEMANNIGSSLEPSNDVISDEGIEEIATYYTRFCEVLSSELNRYISAENMGRLTVPTGIILACGSVGAGVGVLTTAGGLVGFGVGSLFGRLFTEQAKPKDLIKKIEDNLQNQSE